MDPNTVLQRINDLLFAADATELHQACHDLLDWINKDGFEPNWDQHDLAACYYRSWVLNPA